MIGGICRSDLCGDLTDRIGVRADLVVNYGDSTAIGRGRLPRLFSGSWCAEAFIP